jgi:hypothetical protein
VMKGSAYLSEHLIDPITGHADDPTMTPLSRVFGMNEPMFMWICRPGNETLRARFHAGMTSIRFAEDIVTPSGEKQAQTFHADLAILTGSDLQHSRGKPWPLDRP